MFIRLRSLLAATFTAALAACWHPSLAQPVMPLIYDSKKSMYVGAHDLLLVQKAIVSFQDRYIPDTLRHEQKPVRKALGMGYRLGKLLLLDYQEDYLAMLIQHEGMGHLARAREYGATGNSININLPFPFGSGNGFSGYGKTVGNYTPHKNIAASIGGVEANIVMANVASLGFLQNGSIHYRDALIYLAAQNNQLVYIWLDSRRDASNGGDMRGYYNSLNNMYSRRQGQFTMKDLAMQSLVSLVNPLQVFAAYTILYTYGVTGQKRLTHIPAIKIGGARYLPYFNYQLTPFGSEYVFCNVLWYGSKMFTADLGVNEGTFNHTYRLKAKAMNLAGNAHGQMNLHVEAWSQPELKLDGYKAVGSSGNTIGGLIKADIALAPFRNNNKFNLFAQVGYKTKGFTIGEPLDGTLLLRYGIGIRP